MTIKGSKFYTGVIILLPILNIYASFIPSVEIGTLIILIFLVCSFNKGHWGKDIIWLIVLSVFFVCTIWSIIYQGNGCPYTFRYFARYLKVMVIVLAMTSCCKNLFDNEYAIHFLTKVSVVCSVFMIIQNLFYAVGIKIPGILPLNAAVKGDTTVVHIAEGMFRPSSFFIEPAHYAAFQLAFFCYLISEVNLKNKRLLMIITLLGVLLSTSGTGYITTIAVLILAYFLCPELKKQLTFKKTLALLLSLIGFLAFMFGTSIGQQSVGRFLNKDGSLGASAAGRLDSGAEILFDELPNLLKWIGCGFGYRPDDVYFPSLYAILYGDGYIGLAIVFIMLFYYFTNTSSFGKLLCFSYAMLIIGTGVFNFASIGLYFSLIISETNKNKDANNQKQCIYDCIYQ